MSMAEVQLQPRGGRLSVLIVFAFLVIAVVTVMAMLGRLLAPADPSAQTLLDARQRPSAGHLLGTDALGRDVFSRLLSGASLTVLGPFIVTVCAALIAVPLGLLAASRGRLVETVIMRLADTLLAIPSMLVIIVVVGLLGGSYWLAIGVLVVLIVPSGLRLIHSAATSQQNLPYLEAARTMGTSRRRLMFVHVLPNLLPTVVATFLLDFVTALVSLSALAFLGVGAPPGSADWGSMLSEGLRLVDVNLWAAVGPAVLLILASFSVTAVGDWAYARLEGDQHAAR